MKQPRHPLRLLRAAAMGVIATLGSLVLNGACGSTSTPVGNGSPCSLATDCQPGLVCVEQANSASICSDDLSRVAGKAPPEGGAPDAGRDAVVSDAPVAVIKEAGTPEASPPADTGAD